MTRREAKVKALRLAYEAIQKAVDNGGDEAGQDYDGQVKIDAALDKIAQVAYERWQRMNEVK